MIEQELIGEIALQGYLLAFEDCWVNKSAIEQVFICPNIDCFECFAEYGILALIKEAGFVKLAEDQTLPSPTKVIHIWRDYSPDMAYCEGQGDMLKVVDSKVWRKVEVKDGS